MVHHGVAEMAVLPVNDMAARSRWHYIAYGIVMDETFYRPLNKPDATANIQEYLEDHKADTNNDNVPEPGAGETSYFTFPTEDDDDNDDDAQQEVEEEEDEEYDFEEEKEMLWQNYKRSQEALDNKLRNSLATNFI